MAQQHPPVPVDLSGRALLLGEPGDLVLLDCRGATPEVAEERVAFAAGALPLGIRVSDPLVVPAAVAAGASLVHVAAGLGPSHEVRTAARSGVVVVLAGDHEPARAMGLDLVHQGARPGRVVVEVAVTFQAGVVDPSVIRRDEAAGLAVGAVLLPGPGPVDEVVGWEIGMLAHLLDLGVRTVRNVPVARFHRVRAIVDALAEARRSLPPRPVEPAGAAS